MTGACKRWLAACCLILMASVAWAQEEVKIGILAYRPIAQTQKQWAPLAAALNKAIPGYSFVVEAYGHDELARAVASRQVEFILTNPGHYVLMANQSGLSAPLATLVNLEQGKPVASFGGVIFTRADRADISRLQDLRDKTVAATSGDSLGGYQMQAYELSLLGIHFPRDIRLLDMGMPQDKVFDAVLTGRADVGFVRSGVIERLVREGRLDPALIKVVNRQDLPYFPSQISTRLYPEWPVASLPHTSQELKRRVASYLLTLENDHALTAALQIHGFDVPSDYSPVVDVLHELRMPPFDVVPVFTIGDVWERYQRMISAVLLGLGLFLLLGVLLMRSKREKRVSDRKLQAFYELDLVGLTITSPDKGWISINDYLCKLLEYTEQELRGMTWAQLTHPDDLAADVEQFKRLLAHEIDGYSLEKRFISRSGKCIPTQLVVRCARKPDGELD